MVTQQFEAHVRQEPSGVIIDLVGQIDSQAEEALNTAYAEADATAKQVIVLNFSAVEYINSTGIALVVGLLAQARKAHRELRVFGLSDHYMEIFRITRLADFMSIHQDEAGALAS